MILLPTLLFSATQGWAPPAEFRHQYVRRRHQKIEVTAADDFVVVQTSDGRDCSSYPSI